MNRQKPASGDLYTLMRQLMDGQIAKSELDALSTLLIQFAAAGLEIRQRNNPDLHRRILLHKDIAVIAKECIAPLLTRGHLDALARYIRKSAGYDDPALCLAALQRAMNKRISQYLWEIFKESHHGEAKIVRNLRLAARGLPETKRDKEYLIFMLAQSPCAVAPWPVLERTFAQIYRETLDTRKLLAALRGELLDYYRSSVAVDLYNLAKLLSKTLQPVPILQNQHDHEPFAAIEERIPQRPHAAVFASDTGFSLQHKEYRRYGLQVMEKVDRIIAGYIKRGKIELAQGLVVRHSLQELFDDAMNGDAPDTNFRYLERNGLALTRTEYSADLRSRFEYLAGIIRKHLQQGYHDYF